MPSALERCFSYCETSAPETKALSPSPFSTITRTSGSCAKRSSALGIASHMSIEMAFLRAGLLNVSQPIGPCFSATMRSPSAPVARAGCFRRARSSSWVMCLVLEAKTAIVSRAAPARQDFPPSFGLCAGLPYHARQSLRFAAHAGGELLGRGPDDLEAETLEPLAHLGQVQLVDARHALEQLHADVKRAAVSGRGVVERTRPRARKRNQLLHRIRRHRRMHEQHVADFHRDRHRREIPLRVVRNLPEKERIRDERGLGGGEQGVAV